MSASIQHTAVASRHPRLGDVEPLMIPADADSFWQFAGRCVQNLRVPKGVPSAAANEYDALCAAVHDIEHHHQPQRKIIGLPRTLRRLSVNELQKAVGRLRDRLLSEPRAEDFLSKVFCQWIQWEKNKSLVGVLDAVGCRHDDVGTLIGEIPDLTDEKALADVSALAARDGAYDVMIACAGLAMNHAKWAPLWAAVPSLQQMAKVDTEALDAIHPGNATSELTIAPSLGSEQDEGAIPQVSLLLENVGLLGTALNSALEVIARGEVPAPDDVFDRWQTAEAMRRALGERLGTRTRSIAQLMQAESALTDIAHDIDLLGRILSLRHVSDSNYSVHDTAMASAREAISRLRAGQASAAEPLLTPLKALLTLVERADMLDEDQALALDDCVRAEFGPTLALAAIRGRLVIGAAPIPANASSAVSLVLADGAVPSPDSDSLPGSGREDFPSASTSISKQPTIAAAETGSVPAIDEPYANDIADELPQTPAIRTTPPASATAQVQGVQEVGEVTTPDFPLLPQITEPPLPAAGGMTPAVASEFNSFTPAAELVSTKGAIASSLPGTRPNFDDSVQRFRALNWIDAKGRVTKAPWEDLRFYATLAKESEQSWREGWLGYAYFMAEVATRHGTESGLGLADLRAADRLLEHPSDVTVLRDEDRARRVRTTLESGEPSSAAVGLVMEALAPSFPQAWSSEEVARLSSCAQFGNSGIETVVTFLLNGWAAAADPLALIKLDLQRKQVSHEDITESYEDAQEGLRRVVATLWNAAGGRIIHTHCKRAWTLFVEKHVAPLRDDLAPRRQDRKAGMLQISQARQRVADLGRAFTEIMRDQSVKHHDRTAAIAGADQIVAAIEKVVAAKQQLEQHGRKLGASFGAVPHTEVMQLITELPSNSQDRLCTLLLRAALTGEAQHNPLRISTGYLRHSPDIIRTLQPEALEEEDLAEGIRVSSFQYRSAAAALLLGCSGKEESFASRAELLDYLRNYGIEENRSDILAALLPGNGLQPHEKTQLHRRALELGDKGYDTARRLERAWAACDELIDPQAPRFKKLVDEAFLHCAVAGGETPIGESILLQAWLDEAVDIVELARDSIAMIRLGQAQSGSKPLGEPFKALVERQDYRAAMALLHPDEPPEERTGSMTRRTMWRAAAVKHYRQPRVTLVQELKGVPGVQSLVSWWAQPDDNDPTYRDGLRKGLYNLVSGEAGLTQEVIKRRFAVRLPELREHKDRKTIVKCGTIREYFRSSGLNPTFLPQLADIDQIVLTSLPIQVQSSAPLDIYIRAANAEGARSLSVFLEPNIPLGRRDEIAAGLRRRNVRAVVLDDVDICRLCAIGADAEGHNFIPFLEVVFEQLDLELVSPFSTQDGQHIRLESFIGRAASAERVAEGWDYTRLFSGRKLGKSAFLRYIASTYDGHKLPNGKDLSVLFITIAGGSSESWVVDTIIHEMSRRFSLPQEMESSVLSDPVDRFMRYAMRFAKARKSDNVLVILDEADTFIEEQLATYDRVREKSLSFCMMKRMPTPEGSDEMPRLRFLFSGYRLTNTRGGVWANAGDVLILQPLTEEEAVTFLRGMLCRIGVDVGNHAPFAARRCGFQPAVLIRFGESLLKRIKRNSRSGTREAYVVTHDDVIATMSDHAVMDEIRTVVNNNFQGNRLAAAVFGATLLALKDLQPGMALDGGPQQVLDKLSSIDQDLSWLAAMGASPVSQIERQLQEFIDRELLTVSDTPRFGSREYRLKFPHFLSVLTQQTDVAVQVRQHIQSLREGASPARIVESVLPDTSLDAVRYVFRESPPAECSVVVIAGHWPQALTNDKVGLPDRLGCNPSAVARAVAPHLLADRISSGYRVFIDVGQPLWRAMLSNRSPRPLVAIGGVDLLRLSLKHLLEGVDLPIDVRAFATMSQATVHWWFEGARALHFAGSGGPDEIYSLTSGVPLLVGALDEALPNAAGTDVSAGDLAQAIRRVTAAIPKLAEKLFNGPEETRLTDRELELLVMAARVAREFKEFDLQKEFAEAWEILGGDDSVVAPLKDERDRLSLQVLMGIGLLPAATDGPLGGVGDLGRVRFDRDSLLFGLLTAVEEARAR